MSLLSAIPFLKLKSKPPRQIASSQWSDRNQILLDDVNLFYWQRATELTATHYLESVLAHEQPYLKFPIDQSNISSTLKTARQQWKEGENKLGDIFWKDVEQIAYDFLQFSKNRSGTLHLKVVSNNACTKFHIDGYDLRLFTTYYGPGTEWVPEKAVDRSALGTSNDRIVIDSSEIKQIGTSDVAILKGEVPNTKRTVKGIIHRSPEITQKQEKRLILRIDI